ncbi:MAG: SGNH hydrolase domain-containing protein [Chloroflexales bacterium]|nr:SGNH hydrolase domain-containing protein [Chloroflexales bacterium]
MFRWAMPDAQIIVPHRLVGLVMIDYMATAAKQLTTIILTSNQQVIARHVVQPGQFRVYHILANIPWQSTNSTTQITVNGDHIIHDSERTQTVALSQFRIHAPTHYGVPNSTAWPIIAIVLITIVSSYGWTQTPRTIISLYSCHTINMLLIWWYSGLPHWGLPWYVLAVAAYAVIPWITERLQLATPLTATPPHSTITCTTNQATVTQFFAPYKAALAPVLARHPAVQVYDPLPLFCDGTTCAAFDKNHFWYNDATHISVAGAQRIAADIYARFP